MNALAFAHPARAPQTPQSHKLAHFLYDGLVKSGCIGDRARAYQWLIPRTRDTQQLFCILDRLFPNG
jgi:hypothetical protein